MEGLVSVATTWEELAEARRAQETFTRDAREGKVVYSHEAAGQLAANYTPLIADLRSRQRTIQAEFQREGFGGFASTLELQAGFQQQAREAWQMLSQLIEIAYRLQEAFYRSGKRFEEADGAIAEAVKQTKVPMPSGKA